MPTTIFSRHFRSMCLLVAMLAGCGDGGESSSKPVASQLPGTSQAGSPSPAPAAPSSPVTLMVSATATDPDGDAINYQWRATDGTISEASGPSVRWTVPGGKGLHFIYVLASDGKGGYTERTLAVDVGEFNVAAESLPAGGATPPVNPEFSGGVYRSYVANDDPNRSVYLPDVVLQLDPPAGRAAVSTLRGEFAFDKKPARDYRLLCSTTSFSLLPCGQASIGTIATTISRPSVILSKNAMGFQVYGHVEQADGSLCGVDNPFFGKADTFTGKPVTATAELLEDEIVIAGPLRVNAYGDYHLPGRGDPSGRNLSVRISCEGQSPMVASASGFVALDPATTVPRSLVNFTLPNSRPVVSALAAARNGDTVAETSAGAKPTQPADAFVQPDRFLAYKGRDDRLSACRYYRAIGAVAVCDANGETSGEITFDQWKRRNSLAPYNAGNTEVSALYVNKVDLNLTRDMHGTQLSPTHSAFYVCNHPGPNDETQPEIERVIGDAAKGDKQVACVAMDYTVQEGVNGGRPFTKFYTFGPTGKLLTSVNLDGYGEKFLPGVCVACHGGDHYAGRFLDPDRKASPNLGAHFLPFDTDNFHFSANEKLTEKDQEVAIKLLNRMVVATESAESAPTAITNLVNGWYGGDIDSVDRNTTLDKNFVPPSWTAAGDEAVRLYNNVVKHSCRTCHVAMRSNLDFDTFNNIRPWLGTSLICGGGPDLNNNHAMPNAAVTFNRFWNSAQPTTVQDFVRSTSGNTSFNCELKPHPSFR
ncbi:MAG TPA: hypothetical protein VEC35_16210 [Noviherbaspirillum sp.]|nr:hypothetical protein [Noviherbaspirillum sp.]